MKPGASAFTVIFLGASSFAKPRVSPMTPAFDAAYAAVPLPPPLRPASDDIFTMRPPSGMTFSASRVQ